MCAMPDRLGAQAEASMREFHFKGGTSDKFWRVRVDGNSVEVQFGRTGTTGQRKAKPHPTAIAAQAAADRLIAEKLREGYVEASAPRKQSVQTARQRPARSAPVVFVDVFGLTRIGPDDHVKTAEAFGAPPGSVSSEAAGCVLLLHRPGKVNVIVDAASLAEKRRLDSGRVLHPDGSAAVEMGSIGVFTTPIGAGKSKLRHRELPKRAVSKLKPIAFGAEAPSRDACVGPDIAFGAEGAFVAFGARDDSEKAQGFLFVGTWRSPSKPPQIRFEVPLRLAPGSRFSVSVDGQRAVIAVQEIATRQAHLAILDEQGKVSVRSFSSVDVPVAAFGAVAWQPDEKTVVSESLADGARAEFSVSSITRAARRRAKATPLANEGRGRILLGTQRTLYLPWHGETVLDLDRAIEFSRKLPKSTMKARDTVRAMTRKLEPMLDDAGIHLEFLELDADDNRATVRVSGGRDPVVSAFVQQAMMGLVCEAFAGGGGVAGSLDIEGAVERADLLRVIRFTDAHALPFARTAEFWCETYDRELVGSEIETPRGVALEKNAEPVLLWALLDAIAPSKQSIEAKLKRWQSAKPTAAGVLADLKRVTAGRQKDLQAPVVAALLWAASHQFRSAAAPIWDLGLTRLLEANRLLDASMPIYKALTWLASHDSGARARLASALAQLGDDFEEELDYSGLGNLLQIVGVRAKEEEPEDEDAESDDTDDESAPTPARPRRARGKLTWAAFAATLGESVNRRGKTEITDAEFAKTAKALGLARLPPSYCEYQRRFGGLGEWRLGTKVRGVPPTLSIRRWSALPKDRDDFQKLLEVWSDFNEHAKKLADKLRHLLPIGSDGSRSHLCWDPKKPAKRGELGLCYIDGGDWSATLARMRHDCGSDLLELIQLFHYPW
jgi:predicted DNA-binding WGR domain protein